MVRWGKGVVVIGIATAVLGTLFYLHFKNSKPRGEIVVSGNIEATEVRLSFEVSGRIEELLTDEGRLAKEGDIVARLDTEELEWTKEHAEAALKEAQFNYGWLRDDYNRAEELFKSGANTEQQRDAAKNKYDVSKAQLKAANAALRLAELRLSYAELATPVSGFILTKSAEEGEVVQRGETIFTIADLNDVWLTAYVNETDLGRVRLNQAVEVRTDTYPGKGYRGWISFISSEAEFTPKQIQTSEERVKLVYRIKVRAENPNFELKPGMPADGYIKTDI